MTVGAEASIDLGALRHNLSIARAKAPGSGVVAVIKANGYGHGIERTARALHDADIFAVARLNEAQALRAAGIRHPILLLEGFANSEELRAIAGEGFQVVIHRRGQVDLMWETHDIAALIAWLKVDTGMHRLGFAPDEASVAYQHLSAAPTVAGKPRLMTHLANADNRGDPLTQQQLDRFVHVAHETEGECSAANSAGILGWPASHLEWIRPGIMLYGVSPFVDDSGQAHGLRPVMTLRSTVIAVRTLPKGAAIGYGGAWVCPESMPVGVVAIGYGDGYPRHATSGTPVLVEGTRVDLIGRVSMDMICVDLRKRPQTRVGDTVTLWGDGLAVEEVARSAATIPYQLLCGVTQRVSVVER